MPLLVAWIGRVIFWAVRTVGPNVLAVLGLTLVTQTVVGNVVLPQLNSYFAQLPPYVVQTLGAMNADRCFSILFSAIAVRAGVRGLSRVRLRKLGAPVAP